MNFEDATVKLNRPEGRGETGYVMTPSVRVTVLACGHETDDGYTLHNPFRWFCWSCRSFQTEAA